MSALLLEGRALAREIEEETAQEVRDLRAAGTVPFLSVVLVGDNPASHAYVSSKEKACARIGIESKTLRMAAATSQQDLLLVLETLNRDPKVHGILVQFPLPAAVDADRILCAIKPSKDVDGLTPENVGKLLLGFPYTVPCTPAGIVRLLEYHGVDLDGANVVILGRSNIVGKPLAAMLMQKTSAANCTVTVCHSRSRDIGHLTRRADIVVTAMGVPGFLKADMVSPACIVIDVGMNRVEEAGSPKGYRLVGDADFAGLREVVSSITPVPGGVGPLTVAMLLKNTAFVARHLSCVQ